MKTTLALLCICICFFVVSEPKVQAGPTDDYIRMVEKRETEAYMENVRRAQNRPATPLQAAVTFVVAALIVGGVVVWKSK